MSALNPKWGPTPHVTESEMGSDPNWCSLNPKWGPTPHVTPTPHVGRAQPAQLATGGMR
jgi:hypothetical protein